MTKLTKAQQVFLRRCITGARAFNGHEAHTAEGLIKRGLISYTPGYGPEFHSTDHGRAALEDTRHAD